MTSHGNQRIYIAVLNQGAIRPELANLLIHLTHDPRYQIKITYPSASPTTNNRNQIAKQFLEGDWDYLLMLDADTVPHANPLDLVSEEKDIIGYPYPQWNEGDVYWVAMDKDGGGYKPIPPERRHGLQQVDAIGTGCILIRGNVLETLRAPFNDKRAEDGTLNLSEDFYFCQKAKDTGFEVWCDWRVPCSHWKTLDLIEIIGMISHG